MIKLDMRFKVCPYPVIETKKALKAVGDSETIEVLVDNKIATENLEKLAMQLGFYNGFKIEEIDINEYKVTINKGNGEFEEVVKSKSDEVKKQDSGSIIVVSSETMGTGEEELGKKLLEGFIYSLTEKKVELLPKYIVFYNKGILLTTKNKKTIEDLHVLSDVGVEILSCGLCLDYYGLSESLKVGTVTNMYTISDLMLNYNTINIE